MHVDGPAADHMRDHVILCHRLGALGDDLVAVSEHRDRVGYFQDVVEKMGNEDDALAVFPDLPAERRTGVRLPAATSADVGSSRMMIWAPENRTRDNSTSCWIPTGSEPMRVSRIHGKTQAGNQPFRIPIHPGASRRYRAPFSVDGPERRSRRRSGRAQSTVPDEPSRCPRPEHRAQSGKWTRLAVDARISPS